MKNDIFSLWFERAEDATSNIVINIHKKVCSHNHFTSPEDEHKGGGWSPSLYHVIVKFRNIT